MQLRIAALADYTNITNNGKLNILGIFSQIFAANVPATHLQMRLVLQFAFDQTDIGEKPVRIVLQDEDGRVVLSVEGTLIIPNHQGPDPIIVNQVMLLQNVVFPEFRGYEFAVEIDGQPLPVKVPVDVVRATPPEQNQV